MTALDHLAVDLAVVLGTRRLPLQKVLRMGRGAVVALAEREDSAVEVLANGHPIARGRLVVSGASISVEVTELIRKPRVERAPGSTIGGPLGSDQQAAIA